MGDNELEAVMRLAGRNVLDQVTMARFGFDLIDALISLTITHANVEPICRDPRLQAQYATYEDVPPEDLRRPISVNAVAQSLGMPFETVRRRVAKMGVLGVLKVTRQGVYAPTAMVDNPRHRQTLQAAYERARDLFLEFQSRGLADPPNNPDIRWTRPEPLRLVARLSTDYLLRLVQLLMEETGDPVAAAVWLGIFCDNIVVRDGRAGKGGALPRPVSMSALARRLRLSGETTRRRVHALVTAGLCAETSGHVTIDAAVLARPGVQRLLVRNRQDSRRMYQALADYGVVQSWLEESQARTAA